MSTNVSGRVTSKGEDAVRKNLQECQDMEKSIPLNRAQGDDAGALTTKFVTPHQTAAPARMLGLALVHRHKQWKHAQYVLLLFLISLVFGHVKTAAALTLADLQGPWQAALIWSGGGCGPGTAVVN